MQGEISTDLAKLFGMQAPPLETPKSTAMLQDLIAWFTDPDDMVFDFFAGSGTTGHAVMELNARTGSVRRYGVVQFPEPCIDGSEAKKAGFKSIAEICKKRLALAGTAVRKEFPKSAIDFGFRVFKLDRSNIRAWSPDPDDLEGTLFANQDHLVPGRTEVDLLYELLLKRGLDLCVPISSRNLHGKEVHEVGGGVLLICLAKEVAIDEVEALAMGIVGWHRELAPAGDTTCVFRDSAFADDVAKSNMAAILEQNGIQIVRSL